MDEWSEGGATSLLVVTDEQAWQRLERRRATYGIPVSKLAEMAPVDRGRLAKYLAGDEKEVTSASTTWVGRVESALDRFEEETGGPAGDAGLVTFKLTRKPGTEVTVQGPVSNVDELEAAFEKLIAKYVDDESDT